MKVIQARNVHQALPLALRLLNSEGVDRDSRNGPVIIGPSVTTVYERPCERVLFWPERDANPFFHLYESLWMLAGRNDVAPAVFAKNMLNYSDDGKTFHGAYGYRWRRMLGLDQLPLIAKRLAHDPDDRRCVLQMWDAAADLDKSYKDVPCNTIATFQRGNQGELNLTVFCRSNDIIWGCYGANAVHFSFLLEYMALWIGCPVGTYTQVSVNWHAYVDTLAKVKSLTPDRAGFIEDPYADGRVRPSQMFHSSIEEADTHIQALLFDVSTDFKFPDRFNDDEPFFNAARIMLRAHYHYRKYGKGAALFTLGLGDQSNDWILAGTEWMQRRSEIKKVLAGDANHL